MTYAIETDIELIFGWDIAAASGATSRPTTEQLAKMLDNADAIINAEARQSASGTDTSGRLRVIATSLVQKMVVNMFAFTDPETFAFVEVELTDDQKRIIHLELGVWTSLSWEVGTD